MGFCIKSVVFKIITPIKESIVFEFSFHVFLGLGVSSINNPFILYQFVWRF